MRAEDVPLSLAYYTVPELAPPEVVEIAAEAGLAHVGLRLLNGGPNDPAPLMSDARLRRETMARLAATGITPLDANTARLKPETRVAEFAPFLDVAAAMSARHVLATCDDPEPARRVDRFGALAALAEARGLTVEVEFVPWLAVATVADAAALVAAVGGETLGIAVDALHLSRSGSPLADLARVPPRRLRYAHLCDAPAAFSPAPADLLHEAVRERLVPGEGGLDLVGLLRTLPPGLPLALEIPSESRARREPARARVKRAVAAARAVLAEAA